jgi:hypothetical protein
MKKPASVRCGCLYRSWNRQGGKGRLPNQFGDLGIDGTVPERNRQGSGQGGCLEDGWSGSVRKAAGRLVRCLGAKPAVEGEMRTGGGPRLGRQSRDGVEERVGPCSHPRSVTV